MDKYLLFLYNQHMFNHAPQDYKCVLCLPAQGIESNLTMMKQEDIFYKDGLVIAAINSKFIETNPGHAIIFPRWEGDKLYSGSRVRTSEPQERIDYAEDLRKYFKSSE